MSASREKLQLATGIGRAGEADTPGIRAGSNTEWRGGRGGAGGGIITEGCGAVCSGGNRDLPEEDFWCLSARGACCLCYVQKVQVHVVLISLAVWI